MEVDVPSKRNVVFLDILLGHAKNSQRVLFL